jgi:NADPH2:quinone reductase
MITQHGGAEVLQYQEMPMPKIGAGEVLLRHTHIGLNFIDTYMRTGLYPTPLPFVLGMEAAGIIEEVGANVTDFKIGDRVCYSGAFGAYQNYRAINPASLIPIPDGISNEIAAACILKGTTAQYLLRQTFVVGPEHSIFFHAAAGGTGSIFGQWARHLGAHLVGTAGSAQKCELARNNGFNEVINYREGDFVKPAIAANNGQKYDVVYDGVGMDTFEGSLDILKTRGLMVSFGQSSGSVPPFDVAKLNQKGALYITRPSLQHYNLTRDALLANAKELFDLILAGKINIEIGQKFALAEARAAHEALESRKTIGATILFV